MRGSVTRWWWLRHAPVEAEGRLYGHLDLSADCADQKSLRALAAKLPPEARWVTSPLRRSRETAVALRHLLSQRLFPLTIEAALREQHFGTWEGRRYQELEAEEGEAWHRFWRSPGHGKPPEGESFAEVAERVGAAIETLTIRHAGRDVIAVAHGGTIRAALALALGLDPERALAFEVACYSLTRIDHIAGRPELANPGAWRVGHVNLPADSPLS